MTVVERAHGERDVVVEVVVALVGGLSDLRKPTLNVGAVLGIGRGKVKSVGNRSVEVEGLGDVVYQLCRPGQSVHARRLNGKGSARCS